MTTTIHFIPAYYEWHLVDENGKILYAMDDPVDCIFTDDFECKTLEDVLMVVDGLLETEENNWKIGYDSTSERQCLIDFADLPDNTAEVMAQALYDYYVA